jgi:N-methylhydantoinase A/oxoprolinase/acetone carboxylase beta subunit
MTLRLGIDVGGTNTDAVLVDETATIVAAVKRPSSDDVIGGVRDALAAVLADLDPTAVTLAALGTTQCTNAIVERRDLRQVGALRLGAPATTAVPPAEDWPEDLRRVVVADAAILPGGHHVDGREIGTFDEDAVRRQLRSWRGRIEALAITSVFSPVSADHERRAAAVAAEELDVPVSCSHDLGSIGLLERENATVLNAALTGVAARAASAFAEALAEAGLHATPYLSQNDGTLMGLDRVRREPVLTIASGPTNSLRGGAWLSGRTDALVVDVGGTTADVGALVDGFPRESANAVDVGGVRTNFRMPDLVAVALGGGTVVRSPGGGVTLGPDSVGHRIAHEALVFGGETTTLTDVAVAAGDVTLGTAPDRARARLGADEVREVRAAARERLGAALDRMRTSRDEVAVVAVGGGAFLVPDDLPGAHQVDRPPHHEVANAVGAAMAEVSGTVDRVVRTEGHDRRELVAAAVRDARAAAVSAGADPGRLRELDVDEVALSYLPGAAVRLRVRVAGPLAAAAASVGEGAA